MTVVTILVPFGEPKCACRIGRMSDPDDLLLIFKSNSTRNKSVALCVNTIIRDAAPSSNSKCTRRNQLSRCFRYFPHGFDCRDNVARALGARSAATHNVAVTPGIPAWLCTDSSICAERTPYKLEAALVVCDTRTIPAEILGTRSGVQNPS